MICVAVILALAPRRSSISRSSRPGVLTSRGELVTGVNPNSCSSSRQIVLPRSQLNESSTTWPFN